MDNKGDFRGRGGKGHSTGHFNGTNARDIGEIGVQSRRGGQDNRTRGTHDSARDDEGGGGNGRRFKRIGDGRDGNGTGSCGTREDGNTLARGSGGRATDCLEAQRIGSGVYGIRSRLREDVGGIADCSALDYETAPACEKILEMSWGDSTRQED